MEDQDTERDASVAGAGAGDTDEPRHSHQVMSNPDKGKVSWHTMLAALRIPAFAWYWSGQLLSGIGTWSQSIALSWLVLDLTHSAVDLGTITMLQFLPILAFALFGGVIADRLPRRRLLLVTQIALASEAITLGLLVVTHIVTLWEIGVIAFLVGSTNALNNPAQQAFVPDLVGLELVADAVALNSVQVNTARMVGGAVGGLAIAVSGIAGALFLNAVSFVPIVIVLLVIRPIPVVRRRKEAHGSALADVRQGLSYALATTSIRRVVLLFVIIGLFGFNWQVAVPLVARFVLHRHATGFGDLMAAVGAGSLVGAVAVTRDQRASEGRLIIGGMALGVTLVALGLSRSYLLSLLVLGFAGLAGVVASITANTRLQILTPDHMRGRVMGIYVLLMGGTTPVGSFLLGELADRFGTGAALVIFGIATAGGVGLVATLRRSTRSKGLGLPP